MERIIDKITEYELIELTEKIMTTHKYIQMKNNLKENLNQFKSLKCLSQSTKEKYEKIISDVSNDCFTDIYKIPNVLHNDIHNLVIEIKDKLKDITLV